VDNLKHTIGLPPYHLAGSAHQTRINLMPNHLNNTENARSSDSFEVEPKPRVTIHSVMLVLTLALVFTFAFVLGISYFFDNNALKGASSKYLCSITASGQVGVCLKS
jgi:hypothetical protein